MSDKEKNVEFVDTSMIQNNSIGITIAQVQEALGKVHGMKLDPNDPMLLFVTMSNAYLAELQKLLNLHNDALKLCLAEETGKYLSGVKAAADKLSAELSGPSVQTLGGQLRAFQSNMTWLTIISALSAIIIVVALLLLSKGVA